MMIQDSKNIRLAPFGKSNPDRWISEKERRPSLESSHLPHNLTSDDDPRVVLICHIRLTPFGKSNPHHRISEESPSPLIRI